MLKIGGFESNSARIKGHRFSSSGLYRTQCEKPIGAGASDAIGRSSFPPSGKEERRGFLTPATEKAIAWVKALGEKQFVGTESRLMTVFELLRQLAEGTEDDPEARIAELERRKSRIEAEIKGIREGHLSLMEPTQIRDRFLQMVATARGLLGDFREVEHNFRDLDRAWIKVSARNSSEISRILPDVVSRKVLKEST